MILCCFFPQCRTMQRPVRSIQSTDEPYTLDAYKRGELLGGPQAQEGDAVLGHKGVVHKNCPEHSKSLQGRGNPQPQRLLPKTWRHLS
jgi:hypothetical protein